MSDSETVDQFPVLSTEWLNAQSQNDVEQWLNSLSLPQLSQLELQIPPEWSKWVPTPGPQTIAYLSDADVVFYGGQAGGGKSDLLLGLAHNEHHRSIIFRREFPQLRALEDRLLELIPRRDYIMSPVKLARFGGGRTLEFGACQRLGDEQKYQGRPHDFLGFDEITHFLYKQFIFLRGWMRTTVPGQRTRIVCAGNPPQSDEGAWVIEYFRPWLDKNYPHPAMPGELRWFWREPGAEHDQEVTPHFTKMVKGVEYKAESRTFVPAALSDNPFLRTTGYGSNLNMLPEPLRSQLLYGDFGIRLDDRPWQLIPTEWVTLAQSRWSSTITDGLPIEQIGGDIARGGPDETVLYRRYRNIVFPALACPGKKTPDGGSVATMLINAMGNQFGNASEPIVITDAIGVGSSVVDHCRGILKRFTPMNVSNKCLYLDKSKKFKFVNMRAYIYWCVREALDPEGTDPLILPPDPGLLGDLTGIDWKLTPSGIQVEPKDDVKKRIGRSPDRGDALTFALAPSAEGGQGILDYFKGLAKLDQAKQEQAAKDDKSGIVQFNSRIPPMPPRK